MKRKAVTTIAVTVNGRAWTHASGLRNAGPNDSVYVLNHQDGTLTFGDGTHGRTPPVGATIGVSYRVGSGCAGNIAKRIESPRSLTKFWVVVRRNHQAIGWGKRPC